MTKATQAQYDAAYEAGWVVAQKDMADQEAKLSAFVRPMVNDQINVHMAVIKDTVREITTAGLDAALAPPAPPAEEPPEANVPAAD